MTAAETLRANPKFLDRLNSFLTEDEVGVLFLKALTENVLGNLPIVHDSTEHGTIFRSGFSGGKGSVLTFIQSFDPILVAEDLARQAADKKLKAPVELPSTIISRLQKTDPNKAPQFPIEKPATPDNWEKYNKPT